MNHLIIDLPPPPSSIPKILNFIIYDETEEIDNDHEMKGNESLNINNDADENNNINNT